MDKNKTRQIINVLATLLVLAVNGLANALPINGQTTGEISDRFDVFFVPAGYVFSIWGLIYIGLILFAIYQALPSQRNDPALEKIGYLYALSCLANSVWIFLWHYEQFLLTLVAMLVILGCLIAIYVRLRIGLEPVPATVKWLVHVPFSIYLGWITVATIANVTSVLDFLNWGGWGIAPEIWTVIMLVVGTAIAITTSITRRDIAYLLVIIWAFIGIAVKHAGTPTVAVAAWITTGITFIALIRAAILSGRKTSA